MVDAEVDFQFFKFGVLIPTKIKQNKIQVLGAWSSTNATEKDSI